MPRISSAEPMTLASAEDRCRIQDIRVIASSGQIHIPAITVDVGLIPDNIGQMLRLGRQWSVGVLRVERYFVAGQAHCSLSGDARAPVDDESLRGLLAVDAGARAGPDNELVQ